MDEEQRLDTLLRTVSERERRELGEHPEPDELLAYHQGTLGDDDVERLRDHLALCPSCAAALLDLTAFEELEVPAGAQPLTEHERARQRREIARAAVPDEEEAERPHRGVSASRALAAVFFTTTLALSLWVVRLHQPTPEIRADLDSILLPASEGGPSRGGATPVRMPAWAGGIVVRLSWAELAARPGYRLDLVAEDGRVVWSDPDARRGGRGTFQVLLERGLAAGRYEIRLLPGGDPEAVPLATYPLVLGYE